MDGQMKVGDLVKVDEGIFHAGIPEHRVGVIIEKGPEMNIKSLGASKQDDIMNILLAGQTLHFHKMFLETGFYHLTVEEIDEWHADKRAATIAAREKGEDTFHINFDSGGESRLAPRHRWQELNPNMVYEVLRARCRVQRGYHMEASQVKILDTETGRILYCDRDSVVVAG
jgi:hypothetical protein